MTDKLTVEEAWTILCETPDITSPEEYPDHALITMEQLGSFMERTAPASAAPIKIKPLTWRAYGNQNMSGWQGQGAMGYLRYITNRGPDGEEGWWCDEERFDTADEAKAAVQADFEARIRSALAGPDLQS
jgi:hypothetical protein